MITVFVKPYVGIIRFKPTAHYFTISGNRDVYYEWNVVDNAYECSMNSPCPLPVPPKSRYTAWYVFTVYDKPNNSIIEFSGAHTGSSDKATGFEGDGKLLRDTIVPSLTSIR
jgi:hypothetical protein